MLRLVLFAALLGNVSLAAQTPDYPRGYFRNPLNIPIVLAGNFGECRPGHFHSGMDIKTEGRENLPVFAAADGYVSRIKMEPGGFGHGLYITHPNGFTTLYAHLSDFVPAIQAYVREQQYAKESWTVDLSFPPGQFPVKQGDQIAYSGNTGGSTAPHLHFEIRNTATEHPLNPELFGFEIKDDLSPVLKQLALYDMDLGIYNGSPKLFPLRRSGNEFLPANDSLSIAAGSIGIGLVMDDYMNGSENTLAPYMMEWYADSILQGRIRLDDIGYDETRYLNAFADYRSRAEGKPWIQCLFRLPGNMLTHIYDHLNERDGRIAGDDRFHRIQIVVSDALGNSSRMSFFLQGLQTPHSENCGDPPARPGSTIRLKSEDMQMVADASLLYDRYCIDMNSRPDDASLSQRTIIGRASIPVHHYFELSLKPDKIIPFSLRTRLAIIHSDGKEDDGTAATPTGQRWYKASVRALGEFRLVADTTAPAITLLTDLKGSPVKTKSIIFRVKDNYTSVKSFRGELDGKWILFEQHEDTWTYVFDGHCRRGRHSLTVRASDENGNESRATHTFTR